MPLGKEGMFFTKVYPYAHPVVAAKVDPARAPQGMFINTATPSHSVRTARSNGETTLIAVGGAYKPGHPDEEIEMFDDLQRFVRDAFAVRTIDYHWTQ